MTTQELQLVTGDGQTLTATSFVPDSAPSASVVIASALGVPRRVYGRFAAWLAENGLAALTFDYRGISDSELEGIKGSEVRFADWGEQDIQAAFTWALDTHPDAPLFLVGNSCGGQLFGLAPGSKHLAGAVFVAAQTAYWKNWPLPGRLNMGLMFNAVIPLLSMGNTFPARRIGMSSVDAPAGVTRQWARWGRLPRYLFDPKSGIDAGLYRSLCLPVLAYGFDDDSFAPAEAIEALCRELPAAKIERRQISPAEAGGAIGHFGFFRDKYRASLWQPTLDWLRDIQALNVDSRKLMAAR